MPVIPGTLRFAAALASLTLAAAVPAAVPAPQAAAPAATAPAARAAATRAPAATVAPAPVAKGAIAGEENPDWASTLERIAGNVVSIEVDATRAFDTEWNSSAQATGFVVDAERGLILTNRHVVTPGPVTAEATFLNREEVPIYPVYRDPVHDFGLYRYDPSKLKFIKPQALPLFPEGAQIGREIRVVGNNAGEQLSILAGTLAKLDRDAPQYGVGKYNDFNTFYLQAASGTSGGSSGSPVIDIRGRVVALNAGGATGSASSFYLPLGRVKRALELIQQGKPVPRGTIRTVFAYTPYDELRRLGLQGDTEAAVRKAFPTNTGMLVVNEVLPGSPTAGVLQPGDILTRVNGRYVTQFEPLEQVLDDKVGGEVAVEWERGGAAMSGKVAVTDLHAITPDAYLEVGDAILNNLSYQQARHFNVPVRGVYVANPGYMFAIAGVPRGAVVTQVGGRRIDGIDDVEAALAALGDGDFAAVRFFTLDDPRGSQLRSVRMTRQWFAARRCERNDQTGLWPCRDLAAGPAPKPPAAGSTQFAKVADPQIARIAPSLVLVNFDMPYSVSGVTERSYHGTGVVVDTERGLVVVDRNTVPVSLGDVRVTFAGTLQVPGRVVFIHPQHNLAVVAYDPKLIGDTPVRAAPLARAELVEGDNVRVVGLSGTSEIKARTTQVAAVDPLVLPLSRTMRFRDSNLEVAQLVNPPTDFDGVLLDRDGAVTALWSSFAYENGREIAQDNRAVPIGLVSEMLALVKSGQPLRSLDVELIPQPLSKAREIGLSDDWLKKLEQHSPTRRQALGIVRIVGGAPAKGVLQQGDLLLAIDGQVVSRFREVERAVAGKETVQATVWRGDSAKTVEVRTAALSGSDIDRIVLWAGATLQSPHRAMSAQRAIPPVGVYVGYFAYGSPATRYGLYPTRRIVEVDGVPTPNLDAFLKVVTGKPDRASVRLRTLTWNDAPEVITLKLDKHYFPASELVRTPNGWERRALE